MEVELTETAGDAAGPKVSRLFKRLKKLAYEDFGAEVYFPSYINLTAMFPTRQNARDFLRLVRVELSSIGILPSDIETAKIVKRQGRDPDPSVEVESPVSAPRTQKLSPAKFWKLVDRINDNPANISKVVLPEMMEAFANTFFDTAHVIANSVSEAFGEIRDQHDYSAWGVVSEGKRRYQEILNMFKTDPEEAAYYVVEEFDGEEYGNAIFELIYDD
jgi:hypothetical protein